MINPNAALEDHLFEVAKVEAVSQSNAQKDDGTVEMTAFEHGLSPPRKPKARRYPIAVKFFCDKAAQAGIIPLKSLPI